MKHLTTREILRFVDATITNGERTQALAHLDVCARCRAEVEFHRALGSALRHSPLEVAPERVAERVMERLVPQKQHPWSRKIVNNLGNVLAMIIVLSIIGYAMMAPAAAKPSEQSTMITEILTTFSNLYGKAQQAVQTELAKFRKTTISTPSIGSERIIVLTFVSLLILVAFDALVIRKMMRKRA